MNIWKMKYLKVHTKTMNYLWVNLTKYVQGFYTEKHQILLIKVMEHLKKWEGVIVFNLELCFHPNGEM